MERGHRNYMKYDQEKMRIKAPICVGYLALLKTGSLYNAIRGI